jgi:hypothetical protein
MWRFLKIGVPQARGLIREHPIKMDKNWGFPYFRKAPYGGEKWCEQMISISSNILDDWDDSSNFGCEKNEEMRYHGLKFFKHHFPRVCYDLGKSYFLMSRYFVMSPPAMISIGHIKPNRIPFPRNKEHMETYCSLSIRHGDFNFESYCNALYQQMVGEYVWMRTYYWLVSCERTDFQL